YQDRLQGTGGTVGFWSFGKSQVRGKYLHLIFGKNVFMNMTESDSFHYETPLDDIDKAISMADAAFRLYRNISYQQKAVFLESIAELINIQRSPLCEIASKETALPRARLEAEITR